MPHSEYILITRPKLQAREFANTLEQTGIRSFSAPVTEIKYVSADLSNIKTYDALIVTSGNAIHALAKHTSERLIPIYAVGPQTTQLANTYGFLNVQYPKHGNVRALAQYIKNTLKRSENILYVRGADISFDIKNNLNKNGWNVREAILYRAKPIERLNKETCELFKNKRINGCTLFSRRTAAIFCNLIKQHELMPYAKDINVLCISHSVLEYVQSFGFTRTYQCLEPNRDGMLDLISNLYVSQK